MVEFGDFARDARAILGDESLEDLRQEVAILRQLGTIIRGAGGLREFRWRAGGKGKRGGARVIYYYGGDHMPIALVAIYSKSEKVDMTPAEKKAASKLVAAFEREYARAAAPAVDIVQDTRPRRR